MSSSQFSTEVRDPLLKDYAHDDDDKEALIVVMEPPHHNAEEIVRVAIHPSPLDRLRCSGSHYFFDDVPVPYESILAEARKLPSQRNKQLREAEEGTAGDDHNRQHVFGNLWLQCCARLSQAQAEYYENSQIKSGFRSLAVLAYLLMGCTGYQAIKGDLGFAPRVPMEFLWSLCGILPAVALNAVLLTLRIQDIPDDRVQSIVDDLAPQFADRGVHVDFVPGAKPPHLRFRNASSGGASLRDAMERCQSDALRRHREDVIAQRQEAIRGRPPPEKVLGVRFVTLWSWRWCLKVTTAVTGVFYALFFVMALFTGLYEELYRYSISYTYRYRNQ